MDYFTLFITVVGLPVAIAMFDFTVLILSRFKKLYSVTPQTKPFADYTILLPIFGKIDYLKNVSFLKEYGSRVVICTTSMESKEFNEAVAKLTEQYGFRVLQSSIPVSLQAGAVRATASFSANANPYGDLYVNMGIIRDEIMRDAMEQVTSPYCMYLDGDTVSEQHLDLLMGLMVETGFDVASVRIHASNTNTIIEKLQDVEYKLSMDARRIYPWMTSGAATIGKSEVIRTIMRNHSLYFQGGDIEVGVLGQMMGYKVGHLNFTFYTDVPSTFKAWWRQRKAWFGGGFRHAIININQHQIRYPLFFLYNTVLVFLLTPLRWYIILLKPLYLVYVIVLYWVLIFAFHWKHKEWWYVLFPFYALLQVMVLVPLGVYTYFKMAHASNNPGIIRLRGAQ